MDIDGFDHSNLTLQLIVLLRLRKDKEAFYLQRV